MRLRLAIAVAAALILAAGLLALSSRIEAKTTWSPPWYQNSIGMKWAGFWTIFEGKIDLSRDRCYPGDWSAPRTPNPTAALCLREYHYYPVRLLLSNRGLWLAALICGLAVFFDVTAGLTALAVSVGLGLVLTLVSPFALDGWYYRTAANVAAVPRIPSGSHPLLPVAMAAEIVFVWVVVYFGAFALRKGEAVKSKP